VSARRTERLLNLVIALRATRRWLSREQIRAAVPQYEQCESDEAFARMFERDKEDLRELGIPVTTGGESTWFEDDVGYRIDHGAYALPEVSFDRAELAVLGLASRVWQQASLAGPAARALVKLQALGVETDDGALAGLEPRIWVVEPAFDSLYAATRDRAPVTFTYRKPDGEVGPRTLEPWALVSRGGHWYVVGHDRGRGGRRSFRLSRVEGDVRRAGPGGSYQVPAGVDVRALVSGPPQPSDERAAELLVRPGRCVGLRREALDRPPSAGVRPAPPGWERLAVRIGEVPRLAEQLAGYGPDLVVLGPPDLREAVVALLKGALASAVDDLGPAS
jgi:proteasome accessory factor B